jgi:hypothetical protein
MTILHSIAFDSLLVVAAVLAGLDRERRAAVRHV